MGETLQGREDDLHAMDEATRRAALVEAVDYRGDCTLELADGRSVVGFLFHAHFDGAEPFLEYFPAVDGAAKERLPVSDVRRLVFSGRDTADGKSWEAWTAKQEAKKAAESEG